MLYTAILCFRFTVDQLLYDKKLIVDLALEICLEGDTCQVSFDILKQQKFPQPLCDLDMNWSIDSSMFNLIYILACVVYHI
jgi:hypothetical protein